jgi:NADP-dependent 3-hydroxy acid dehydrogenase YdfG
MTDSKMERELRGRICVVTKVALLARRQERVQSLAEQLGEAALPLEADVRDLDALRAAGEQIRARFGRVDCLVNNAGVMLNSPFRAGLVDEWRTMVETNLLGVLYATHVFVDDLSAGGGDVVNISSVAGRVARVASNVYAATKHAVTGWSDALRQELLAYDVRVVCVEPGAVATELPSHISHPETRKDADTFYGGSIEILTAEDIASLIVYAVTAPERVSINEVLVRPLQQL